MQKITIYNSEKNINILEKKNMVHGYSRETPLWFSDNALTLRLNAFVEFMNVVGGCVSMLVSVHCEDLAR